MEGSRRNNKTLIFLLIIIIALLIGILLIFLNNKTPYVIKENSQSITKNFEGEKIVTKIIDGDTIIAEGENVRLLGIDSDERSYPCYDEAKERLEELVLGKEVRLEKDQTDKDQYQRYLRYLFLNNQNINLYMYEAINLAIY